MSDDWSSLPDETRAVVREVVGDLLHDWIKYMEMRLLSVDWSAPPERVESIVNRAVRRTRQHGDEVRGVRQLWEAGRARLLEQSAGEPIRGLVTALTADVEALEGLLGLDRAQLQIDPAHIDTVIRQPGRRLRVVRDRLYESTEPF